MNDSEEKKTAQKDSAPNKIVYDEGGSRAVLFWIGGISLVIVVLAAIASKS